MAFGWRRGNDALWHQKTSHHAIAAGFLEMLFGLLDDANVIEMDGKETATVEEDHLLAITAPAAILSFLLVHAIDFCFEFGAIDGD